MKKLTLNKSIISNLTRKEAGKIKGGGTAITDRCITAVYEGCDPGLSWDHCSNYCTNVCDTRLTTCLLSRPHDATCNGCQTDYNCDPNVSVVFCQSDQCPSRAC